MLHIPALWYFGTSVTYPPWLRRVKLVVIPPRFLKQQYLWNIAIQLAVGCYNSWANLWCSGCYPLGEKLLWNRSIAKMLWIINMLIFLMELILINLSKAQQLDLFENVFNDKFDGWFSKMRSKFIYNITLTHYSLVWWRHNMAPIIPVNIGAGYSISTVTWWQQIIIWTSFQNDWSSLGILAV